MTAAIRDRQGPLVRLAFAADCLVELLGAAVLLAFAGTIGRWWHLPTEVVGGAGAVFVLAFAGVAALWWRSSLPGLRVLSLANAGGGVVLWGVFAAAFTTIEVEGRWLLAAFADTALCLGMAQWLVLRRLGRGA